MTYQCVRSYWLSTYYINFTNLGTYFIKSILTWTGKTFIFLLYILKFTRIENIFISSTGLSSPWIVSRTYSIVKLLIWLFSWQKRQNSIRILEIRLLFLNHNYKILICENFEWKPPSRHLNFFASYILVLEMHKKEKQKKKKSLKWCPNRFPIFTNNPLIIITHFGILHMYDPYRQC